MQKFIIFVLAVSIAAACADKTTTTAVENSSHANASQSSDHSGHNSMDHSSMTSSPGASSAPVELQFIDTMIVHHRGAVDMAKLSASRAEHTEIKTLSDAIIRDQQREIDLMNGLRKKWFGDSPAAINMDFPGMSAGMHSMDLKKLEALRGNDFDVEFIRQMIPHHQGAIEMSKHIGSNDSYAELKKLADDIIKAQETEVRQMNEWLSIWEKR